MKKIYMQCTLELMQLTGQNDLVNEIIANSEEFDLNEQYYYILNEV